MESRKSQFKNKLSKLTGDKKYSQEIENLRKNFKQFFDKKIELQSPAKRMAVGMFFFSP